MPIDYLEDAALFRDVVSVEEAERLLEWLQQHATPRIDLSACTHLHPANLQVLMAAGSRVDAWPAEPGLGDWLKTALPARTMDGSGPTR